MKLFLGRLPIFTLIILGKLLLIRLHVFSDFQPLFVILLEFMSVFILFGITEILTPKGRIISFVILDVILSTLFLSMIMYYDHFGRLLNFHVILQARMLTEIGDSVKDLFSPKFLVLYLDIVVFLIIFVHQKGRTNFSSVRSKSGSRPNKYTVLMIAVAITLSLAATRAYPEKENIMSLAQNTGILNAEFYEIFQTLAKNKPSNLMTNSLTQVNINNIKRVTPNLWPKYFGAARGKNLIMIQLESTQNFVMGLKINGQEVTPNLNRLAKEGLYFPYVYSQIGQGNTSDAEFIVNTSIYPLEKRAISSVYQNIEFPSLPRILKAEGYYSVTFHPNKVTFWNRDKLYPALGFDSYYDKAFYKDEDMVGRWGSSDEILFLKALPVLLNLHKQNNTFYASFITMTNHNPYGIPKAKSLLKLPKALEGTFIGNYLNSVHYEDYALGKFLESLRASGLWEKSVIIAYGDHFGINNYQSTQYKEDLARLIGRAHDAIDALNIPLIIKVPGIKQQTIPQVGGQIDILPTIANLFGIRLENQIVFGQDLLNTGSNLIGFRYYHPEGTIISGDLFHLSGNNTGININNRKASSNQEFYKQQERIKQLLQLSDQYLEQLSNRGKQNEIRVEISS